MTPRIGGVDLSLTGLGLCMVPADWNRDFSRIRRCTLGVELTKAASPRERVLRRRYLARDSVTWLERQYVTHVFIEGYPIGGRVFNLDKLAELRGVVEDELLLRLDIAADTSPLTTARKLLFGWVPRQLKKEDWQKPVWDAAGGVFQTTDEVDAFVAANYGMSELGLPCIACPAPEKKAKARARRKAA